MRNYLFVVVYALMIGANLTLAFAQNVRNSGWIDIGSTRETATNKRAVGSFYKGSGIQIYTGKPPKPYLQHDMGAYELDPAPESDRNKPFDRRVLSGVWELLPDSNVSETLSTRIPPMTPLGIKKLESNIPDFGPRSILSMQHPQNAPYLQCDPTGWPRVVFQPLRPMEFIQIPGRILQHWAFHDTWRTIYTDGRLLPRDPDPTFMGYSVGKWVADNTFVADTVGVDDRTWLDHFGSVHSDKMELQERWRRLDHNTLSLTFTLKDPAIYTETWEGAPILFQLYPNLELDHLRCVPSEELQYRANSPSENPNAGQR